MFASRLDVGFEGDGSALMERSVVGSLTFDRPAVGSLTFDRPAVGSVTFDRLAVGSSTSVHGSVANSSAFMDRSVANSSTFMVSSALMDRLALLDSSAVIIGSANDDKQVSAWLFRRHKGSSDKSAAQMGQATAEADEALESASESAVRSMVTGDDGVLDQRKSRIERWAGSRARRLAMGH